MDNEEKSNSQLSDMVADYASKLFFDARGYGLNIAENVAIGDAAYSAFNSAAVAQQRKEAA